MLYGLMKLLLSNIFTNTHFSAYALTFSNFLELYGRMPDPSIQDQATWKRVIAPRVGQKEDYSFFT